MLIPLTRQKFEQLIPRIATAEQYQFAAGKFPDLLRRLLISVVGVVAVWILKLILFGASAFSGFLFAIGAIAGLYWLWGPVLWASLRNAEYRKYQYSGFWRGRVLDVFVSEDLIGSEETVNNKGDLVIVENRERRLNLELGDETGFTTEVQAPLKRNHQLITPGLIAEMVVLSNRADLGTIAKVTDVYIPKHDLWVSDYPYLQRNMFTETSQRLRNGQKSQPRRRTQKKNRPRTQQY